jgi:hypothetical protein
METGLYRTPGRRAEGARVVSVEAEGERGVSVESAREIVTEPTRNKTADEPWNARRGGAAMRCDDRAVARPDA